MRDTFIDTELQSAQDAGLYRRLRRVEGDQGAAIDARRSRGDQFLLEQLSRHRQPSGVGGGGKEAIDRYGCGSGASRLISGNMTLHEELEGNSPSSRAPKRRWCSTPDSKPIQASSLPWPARATRSSAMRSITPALSTAAACRAPDFCVCALDLDQLEAALKQAASARRRLIVTESIFSMDGDEAPLRRSSISRKSTAPW